MHDGEVIDMHSVSTLADGVPAMVVVLALDIATHTGWAALRSDGSIETGTTTLKADDHPGARMACLRSWLTETENRLGGVDFIAWEDAFRQPGKAGAIHHRLVGAMLAWAHHHEIGVLPVAVSTIKRHATGRGNASKAEMIEAAEAAGYRVVDDNAADALHLLRLVLSSNPGLGPCHDFSKDA